MVILEVKKNKSNGQKFINVPKDSALQDGDYIEVIKIITHDYREIILNRINSIKIESKIQEKIFEYIKNSYKPKFFIDSLMMDILPDEYEDDIVNDINGIKHTIVGPTRKKEYVEFYNVLNILVRKKVIRLIPNKLGGEEFNPEYFEFVPMKEMMTKTKDIDNMFKKEVEDD